jgi:hypothetical protein
MDCVGPLKPTSNVSLFQLRKKSSSQKERNISVFVPALCAAAENNSICPEPHCASLESISI